eukprot:CAMPEP_0204879956 /NCGR_PEP_ID=MMETSP1349-20130617/1379_1 /ASSEMBLY_ACC=CAM_ASM_000710 /TAXON_ID=215587 /ORGANISM="Aplanochytrium stocchinoi, Strain GSBS06" /LENGTH=228 /DNA_ID=CAMNT_0052038099 /DNA_START=193 /DNA_END=880 /DNA_ORIENTATION=+
MDILNEILGSNKIVLISNTFSPFCMNAETCLENFIKDSSKYKVVHVDNIQDGKNIEKASEFVSKKSQLPHLYLNGKIYQAEFDESTKCNVEWALMEAGAIENPQDEDKETGEDIAKAARFLARKKANEMPFCFIKGKYVGNIKDIQELHKSGDLEFLMVDAGALPAPPTDMLNDMIDKNPVLILTNSYSPYCLRVAAVMEQQETMKDAVKIVDFVHRSGTCSPAENKK